MDDKKTTYMVKLGPSKMDFYMVMNLHPSRHNPLLPQMF